MRRRIAFLSAALAFAMAVAAEPLADWYAASPRAATYLSVRGELAALLADCEAEGIPPELLMARIAEGAGKRVEPGRLVSVLRVDLSNYVVIRGLVAKHYPGEVGGKRLAGLLERGGMALRSGLDAVQFGAMVNAASARGADAARTMEAILAVAAAQASVPLDEDGKMALAVALALSGEGTERFSQLASILLRGRAGKLQTRDLVAIIVGVLGKGGGFLQVDREITRRIK
jgi:hypothetical protein